MRCAFLHACLLAFLIAPIITAGGYAASTAGGSPVPTGRPSGEYDPSVPLFPNISFTGQTLAAEDWYEQGFTLTNEERYGEALQAYEEALSCNSSLLNAWYYSGDALFRLGRYSEALLAFENATAVDPDFVDAYFYESLVYEKLGRFQDRKDALRRGLEAADRRKTREEAATRPVATTRGSLPEPGSPGTALLGAGIALGFRAFMRRQRGS
jgi:tetratricopeptide (TPR) repeat protein